MHFIFAKQLCTTVGFNPTLMHLLTSLLVLLQFLCSTCTNWPHKMVGQITKFLLSAKNIANFVGAVDDICTNRNNKKHHTTTNQHDNNNCEARNKWKNGFFTKSIFWRSLMVSWDTPPFVGWQCDLWSAPHFWFGTQLKMTSIVFTDLSIRPKNVLGQLVVSGAVKTNVWFLNTTHFLKFLSKCENLLD